MPPTPRGKFVKAWLFGTLPYLLLKRKIKKLKIDNSDIANMMAAILVAGFVTFSVFGLRTTAKYNKAFNRWNVQKLVLCQQYALYPENVTFDDYVSNDGCNFKCADPHGQIKEIFIKDCGNFQ